MQPSFHRKTFLSTGAAWVALVLAIQCLDLASEERTPGEGAWWPRKGAGAAGFVGSTACSPCHARLVMTHQVSSTARAMRSAENCQILASHPSLVFRNGEYTYQILRESGRSLYKVVFRDESISVPVTYCVGDGKTGQTYLLQHNGTFYESRVSFYSALEKLDLTIGALRTEPESLEAALGKKLTAEDVRNCFSCHGTGAVGESAELRLATLAPGVGCEACHGPGAEHVTSARQGRQPKAGLLSLSRLNGDELSQHFCGSCHRSFTEVIAMPDVGGAGNVRFQPYRLAKSSCYQGDPKDRRISCVACHNPHEKVVADSNFYDVKCLACHASGSKSQPEQAVKSCRTATKKCTSCHMPRTDLPEAHAQFTDHFIRIVRADAPHPK